MTWQSDKRWADRFTPQIREIVAQHLCPHLIREAPVEEDRERNSDLVVLNMRDVRIACRVRKNAYAYSYANEFTIRAGRPSGVETELQKVLRGWGDYIFYGFADDAGVSVVAWTIGDLGVFRLWFQRYLARNGGAVPGIAQPNHDGSSAFQAFNIGELPPDFVVARVPFKVPTLTIGARV